MSFWRDLVLAQNATLIVNLCGDYSGTWRDETDLYWPVDSSERTITATSAAGTSGGNSCKITDADDEMICISLRQSTQPSEHLTLYDLKVSHGGKTRQIRLIHFSGWPDCGVPEEPSELVGFNQMLKELLNHYINGTERREKKAIVHCRQGHGRTGTTVTILSRLLQAHYQTICRISFVETLKKLR